MAQAAMQAVRIVRLVIGQRSWTDRIAGPRQTVLPSARFAADLLRRFETSGAPGMRAGGFATRMRATALDLAELELTVSPYAPPQRQLSTVRQGAPMWSHQAGPDSAAPPAPAARPQAQPTGRPAGRDEIPSDLKALLELHRSRGRI